MIVVVIINKYAIQNIVTGFIRFAFNIVVNLTKLSLSVK